MVRTIAVILRLLMAMCIVRADEASARKAIEDAGGKIIVDDLVPCAYGMVL